MTRSHTAPTCRKPWQPGRTKARAPRSWCERPCGRRSGQHTHARPIQYRRRHHHRYYNRRFQHLQPPIQLHRKPGGILSSSPSHRCTSGGCKSWQRTHRCSPACCTALALAHHCTARTAPRTELHCWRSQLSEKNSKVLKGSHINEKKKTV